MASAQVRIRPRTAVAICGRKGKCHAGTAAGATAGRTISRPTASYSAEKIRSALGDHDLQVPARDDHRSVFGSVHPPDQRKQVILESALARLVECRKGFEHRAIVGLEDLQEVLGQPVAEHEIAWLDLDGGSRCPKHLRDAGLCA